MNKLYLGIIFFWVVGIAEAGEGGAAIADALVDVARIAGLLP